MKITTEEKTIIFLSETDIKYNITHWFEIPICY